jgi:hypothetical protein
MILKNLTKANIGNLTFLQRAFSGILRSKPTVLPKQRLSHAPKISNRFSWANGLLGQSQNPNPIFQKTKRFFATDKDLIEFRLDYDWNDSRHCKTVEKLVITHQNITSETPKDKVSFILKNYMYLVKILPGEFERYILDSSHFASHKKFITSLFQECNLSKSNQF